MRDFYYVEFNYDGLNQTRLGRVYDAFVIFGSGVKGITKDMMKDLSFPDLKITMCEKYDDVLKNIKTNRNKDDGSLSQEFLDILDRQEIVRVDWEFNVSPWEIPPLWQWEADKNGDPY